MSKSSGNFFQDTHICLFSLTPPPDGGSHAHLENSSSRCPIGSIPPGSSKEPLNNTHRMSLEGDTKKLGMVVASGAGD